MRNSVPYIKMQSSIHVTLAFVGRTVSGKNTEMIEVLDKILSMEGKEVELSMDYISASTKIVTVAVDIIDPEVRALSQNVKAHITLGTAPPTKPVFSNQFLEDEETFQRTLLRGDVSPEGGHVVVPAATFDLWGSKITGVVSAT